VLASFETLFHQDFNGNGTTDSSIFTLINVTVSS
jgi:hypothetical protein